MTYQLGEAWVVGTVCAVLVALHVAELVSALRGRPTTGYRVRAWARRNRWFAALLLVVVATLLAHFFLNPLPAS